MKDLKLFRILVILCSFAGILYTFNVCNISLHLQLLKCVHIKNAILFLVAHICVDEFTFLKSKFSLLLKFNLLFFL